MEEYMSILDKRLLFFEVEENDSKLILLKNLIAGTKAGKILDLKENSTLDYEKSRQTLIISVDGKTQKPW